MFPLTEVETDSNIYRPKAVFPLTEVETDSNIYRPKDVFTLTEVETDTDTKWLVWDCLSQVTKLRQGNVFTPAFQLLCSRGGRGLCPSMHHRSHDQGGLCPGRSLSGRSLSRVSLSVQGVSVWGSLSRGGDLCPGPPLTETLHTVTRGQYASYWNAFLFGGLYRHRHRDGYSDRC